MGNYDERTTGLAPLSINNLATTAEFAFGYTYLWTDHLSMGARVRGFLYGIRGDQPGRPPNQFGEHAGGAFGPQGEPHLSLLGRLPSVMIEKSAALLWAGFVSEFRDQDTSQVCLWAGWSGSCFQARPPEKWDAR